MVLTLAVPLRKFYGMEDFITMRHIHNMTKVMLVTGMIVAYGYANEAFFAWYSANPYEQFMMKNRMEGPYAVFYWSLIAINAGMIQLFWFRKVRDNVALLFVLSLFVNVGMWLERFIIIVTSLHRDFLPSSWDMYAPTRWDFGMFAGTIGLFLALFFLFVRFLPAIAIFEMRTIVPEAKLKAEHHGDVMSHAEAHAPTSPSAHAAAGEIHGLMAEFDNPTALVAAANRARLAGYRQMDAYSPIPIEELSEALGCPGHGCPAWC
jgi:molybdopterin-containing oxidoreductase family membrane subunit